MKDIRGAAKREQEFYRREGAANAIRAELTKDNICSALGIPVQSPSPVLALCRKLVEVGHHPNTPIAVYRAMSCACAFARLVRPPSLKSMARVRDLDR